jgi:hypothetical protein
MLQNVSGQQVDYDSFKNEFDKNPQLKNLVDRFDANGVVIKTKAKEPKDEIKNKEKSGSNILNTAKKAASKFLGK